MFDIGLPFKPMAVSPDWSEWPSLPDLFPISFPGVKTSSDSLVVDVDLDKLKARIQSYFEPSTCCCRSPSTSLLVI